MELLCKLHAESTIPANDGLLGTWDKRGRYIELRRELSALLTPLFADLSFTEMLILGTEGPAKSQAEKDADPTLYFSRTDTLAFTFPDSGLNMSIKKQ